MAQQKKKRPAARVVALVAAVSSMLLFAQPLFAGVPRAAAADATASVTDRKDGEAVRLAYAG